MLFQCDLASEMKLFQGEYSSSLNSMDLYDTELPLTHSSAHGGTMIMWKIELDPYVTVITVDSFSFLPIVFSPRGGQRSIHVAVYLPTHGKDSEFLEQLTKLIFCIDNLREQYPEAPLYLRGDFNVNNNNHSRTILFRHQCYNQDLNCIPIKHATYHHFLGDGLYDSHLDKLMYSKTVRFPEILTKNICKFSNPLVNSHHDLIISKWKSLIFEECQIQSYL